MGELIYTDQAVLQDSLSRDFIRLYSAISNAYYKHGYSPKYTQILKQFAEYFYRQTIQKKQYQSLRAQMIKNTLTSATSQKCGIFADEKISGYLYALPAKNVISSKNLQGNINILTIGHGAIQVEQPSTCKLNLLSQRLTLGQSAITMKANDTQTNFRAKTNVSIFLCISCHEEVA